MARGHERGVDLVRAARPGMLRGFNTNSAQRQGECGVSVAERQQEVNGTQHPLPCRIVVKHRHTHARPGWQLQPRFWTPRRPRMRRGGGRVELSSEPASVQSEGRPHRQRTSAHA
jgi:hypothetical protein